MKVHAVSTHDIIIITESIFGAEGDTSKKGECKGSTAPDNEVGGWSVSMHYISFLLSPLPYPIVIYASYTSPTL